MLAVRVEEVWVEPAQVEAKLTVGEVLPLLAQGPVVLEKSGKVVSRDLAHQADPKQRVSKVAVKLPPLPPDTPIFRAAGLMLEYDVEAVIWLAQAFCGTHQWDIVDGAALFEKEGIPFLQLERDVTIPEGIFRVRIEATLEIAKGQLV